MTVYSFDLEKEVQFATHDGMHFVFSGRALVEKAPIIGFYIDKSGECHTVGIDSTYGECYINSIDYESNRRYEIITALDALVNSDIEYAHRDADNIMCTLLREIGYGDIVAKYEKVEKSYSQSGKG
jgi:hypothetical protein